MRDIRFVAQAAAEFDAAIDWYADIDHKLAASLNNQVWELLSRASRNPLQFKIVLDSHRSANLVRFPYQIYFDSNDSAITVYCFFNTAQDPALWQRRLSN